MSLEEKLLLLSRCQSHSSSHSDNKAIEYNYTYIIKRKLLKNDKEQLDLG